jgi:hypothetical protein
LVVIITTVNPEIIIMMNLLKSDFHTLTATLTLGVLSIGFAPAALAISTYDAMAEFTLTLTNVTNFNGTQVTSGWEVTASGFDNVFFSEAGVASATGSTTIIDPPISLAITESITRSSISSGSATNGIASTKALSDLDISVDNFSGMTLTFSFDFSARTDATTTTVLPGTFSSATAYVDMLDGLGFVDITASTSSIDGKPPIDTGDVTGVIDIDMLDGQFNNIFGFVDTFGQASAVPVPATVWLFGSGLLGLAGIARRKKAA